jgi:hypothetical protein
LAYTTDNHLAIPLAVPLEVVLRQDEVTAPRFTPRELRMIKEHLGRSFTQILTDDDSDDKFTVMAWLKLRRDGHDLDWREMDDVVITIGGSPDPTSGPASTTSPRSASSGE